MPLPCGGVPVRVILSLRAVAVRITIIKPADPRSLGDLDQQALLFITLFCRPIDGGGFSKKAAIRNLERILYFLVKQDIMSLSFLELHGSGGILS